MIALLLPVALADEVSFIPWSGAALTVTNGDSDASVGITTPVAGQPQWTMGATATVPAGLLAGTDTDGTFGVTASVAHTNARTLALEVERTILAGMIAAQASPEPDAPDAIADAAAWQATWCDVIAAEGSTSLSTSEIVSAVGAATATTRATWARRVAALTADYGNQHHASCAKVGDPARRLAVVGDLIERSAAVGTEATIVAANAAATPLDELAKRLLTRPLYRIGPVVGYDWTVADALLAEHGADIGAAGTVYFPAGLALGVAAGGTIGWALDDGGATFAPGGFGEVGIGWASPALLRLPQAGTTDPSGGGSSHYVALEGTWRQEFAADVFTGTGRAVVGLRPTGSGIGISAGAAITLTESDVAVLPTVSLSGELPNLVSL